MSWITDIISSEIVGHDFKWIGNEVLNFKDVRYQSRFYECKRCGIGITLHFIDNTVKLFAHEKEYYDDWDNHDCNVLSMKRACS